MAQYNGQKKIYINKKLLKETKVSITESLTVQHVAKLKEAKENIALIMSGLMTTVMVE